MWAKIRKLITKFAFHACCSLILVKAWTHFSHNANAKKTCTHSYTQTFLNLISSRFARPVAESHPPYLQELDLCQGDHFDHTAATHGSRSGSVSHHRSCKFSQKNMNCQRLTAVCHRDRETRRRGRRRRGAAASFLSFCRNIGKEGMTHQLIWEPHGPFPVCLCVC